MKWNLGIRLIARAAAVEASSPSGKSLEHAIVVASEGSIPNSANILFKLGCVERIAAMIRNPRRKEIDASNAERSAVGAPTLGGAAFGAAYGFGLDMRS